MNDVTFRHYLQFLKEGKKICFKCVDGSVLQFYVRDDGVLLSKDEHGLYTDTGLSGIEFCYVINGLDEGKYIETDDSGSQSKAVNPDLTKVEAFVEKARIIVKQLVGLGYGLEDVYRIYNESEDVMRSIDNLSPEFFLDLQAYRKPLNYVEMINYKTTESEKKITDNLFDSGKLVISENNGDVREYYIDGGKLYCRNSNGEQLEDFLASAMLRHDIDRVLAGEVIGGNVQTDIAFKDEMAERKIVFGMNTARLFSMRLGYNQELFRRAMGNQEFRAYVDRSNDYLWKKTEKNPSINMDNFLKDATSRVSKRELLDYENFVDIKEKTSKRAETNLEKDNNGFIYKEEETKKKVENIYKKASTQVYEILKYLPAKEFVKIPQEEIVKIDRNREPGYEFTYNVGLTLEDQKVEYETKVILTYLFWKYFLNNSQKIKVGKILEYNDRLTQNDSREPEGVQNELENRKSVEEISEMPIQSKQNIFQRIIAKFKSVLGIF